MQRTALDRVRFAWHDVRGFIARVYEGADEANVPFLASGLTFDALLAAIPFMLLVLSVTGFVVQAGAERAQVELTDYLRRFLPVPAPGRPDPFAPVLSLLERAVDKRGALGALGVPLFIWFSTRLFGSLRASLCEIFDYEDPRSWVRGKLQDVILVLASGSLFLLSTALSEGVRLLSFQGLGFLEFFTAQLLAFVVVLLLFIVIFRFVPAHRIAWDVVLMAAVVCGLGFEVARWLIGTVMDRVVTAGSMVRDATIGGVLLFVVWTWYMAFVFLVGGQIAQVYELRRRQRAQKMLLG